MVIEELAWGKHCKSLVTPPIDEYSASSPILRTQVALRIVQAIVLCACSESILPKRIRKDPLSGNMPENLGPVL